MSTLTTRVAGTLIRVTTEPDERDGRDVFVVRAGDEFDYDVIQTANAVGNYSKVVALTQSMVNVIEQRIPVATIPDPYFPFDTQEA